MSEFRRRLMSSANTSSNYECLTEMFTNTASKSITIPDDAVFMDIFLVGGGGGGGSWHTWGYTCGSAGLGGECFCKRRIPLQGVTSIKVKCGSGGNRSTSITPLIRSATNGGVTTLTTNVETYSALGGIGGYNSMNQSGLTAYKYPDGNTSYMPIYLGKCVEQTGYDNRVMTEYGLEGSYMKGLEVVDFGYWINVDGVYSNEESVELALLYDNTVYPNFIDTYRYGIPAFFEEGNSTFAAQGSMIWKIRNATTYGEQGSAVYNSTDNVAMYNACGYGGGGFGGRYRTSSLYYGGNGTQGIVVIRWYIKI